MQANLYSSNSDFFRASSLIIFVVGKYERHFRNDNLIAKISTRKDVTMSLILMGKSNWGFHGD